MPFTRRLTLSYLGADVINQAVEKTGGAEFNLDEAVVDGAAGLSIVATLDVSALKLLYLISDQALTVKTNDNGSPNNTFTLAANVPFAWVEGGAALRDTAGALVTVDVATLKVTNASGNDATLKVRALYDPTP